MPPSLKNIPPEYFLRYARKSRTAAHLEHARLRRILRRALVPLRPRLPFRQMYISAADRVGKYELRTAGAYCPALPVMLALRCECELYGTAANQVKVLCGQGAQCGSMICFYSANLRALAFLLLYHPKFSHKMRIPTRLNHTFPMYASSYLVWRCQSPFGNRKCPGGTFSRKAVTDLFGQGPNVERFYRKLPVFLSKSYTTFSDKTKSSLYRLLFSVRVELSSRAVASQVLSP